jgi:Ca2+-binding EF-hand superfamily protein
MISDTDDDEKWKKIIKEVDTNGDGVIDFEEFCNAIDSFITKSYTDLG